MRVLKDDIVDILIEEKPFDQTKTRIYRPNILSNRMSAQSGWFTIHHYPFIQLDNDQDYINSLGKMLISFSPSALTYLDQISINQSTLFPELDGLCNYLNWKAEFNLVGKWKYIPMPQGKGDLPPSNPWD